LGSGKNKIRSTNRNIFVEDTRVAVGHWHRIPNFENDGLGGYVVPPEPPLFEQIEFLTGELLDLNEAAELAPDLIYSLRLKLKKAREILEAGEYVADKAADRLREVLLGDGNVHPEI
jgi:hypothetical protein